MTAGRLRDSCDLYRRADDSQLWRLVAAALPCYLYDSPASGSRLEGDRFAANVTHRLRTTATAVEWRQGDRVLHSDGREFVVQSCTTCRALGGTTRTAALSSVEPVIADQWAGDAEGIATLGGAGTFEVAS